MTDIMLELEDGSIVPAIGECDCGCIPELHDGPHWLYENDIWRRRNKSMLEQATFYSLLGFAQEEKLRLDELAKQMKSHNVARIIRPESGLTPRAVDLPPAA